MAKTYFELNAEAVGNELRRKRLPMYNPESIDARLLREGNPWDIYFSTLVRWVGTAASGGNTITTNITRMNFNKAYYAKCMALSASKSCVVRTSGLMLVDAATGLARVGNSEDQFTEHTLAAGVSVVMLCDQLFTPDRKSPSLLLVSVIDQDPKYIIPIVSGGGVTAWTINKNGGLTGNNVNIGNGFYTYTINITNGSVGASSGVITITDQLPTDARFIPGTPANTGWTISEANGVLTATTSDVVAAAASKTLTITLAPKSNIQLSLAFKGIQCDVDINYNAKPMLMNGTSISYGSGATSFNTHFSYLIRNWLRDVKGIPLRIVNRAIPGSTSTNHENLRAFSGRYELAEAPDYIFDEHGINDSAGSIPASTTVANSLAFIADCRRKWGPDKWIFSFAPFPAQVVGWEAGNAAIHAVKGPAIAALNDPKVRYVSETRAAWNPVTESGTYTTDGTHPNDAGQIRIFNAFVDHVTNNNLQL